MELPLDPKARDRSRGVARSNPPPRWNLAAVVAPLAGYICALLVYRLGEGLLWRGEYYADGGFLWVFGVWARSASSAWLLQVLPLGGPNDFGGSRSRASS
jgi:hypothetical protein